MFTNKKKYWFVQVYKLPTQVILFLGVMLPIIKHSRRKTKAPEKVSLPLLLFVFRQINLT